MATTLQDVVLVRDHVRNFTNRERAIQNDAELSNDGKARRLTALRNERQEYRSQAVGIAIAAFDDLLARFNANDAARKAEQDAAAKLWDYERLNYQAKAAEARVKGVADMRALEALYENALNSGDRHAYRAFAELATMAVRTRWAAFDAHAAELLARKMEKDLEALLLTPELKAINDRGAALASEALELKAALQALHSYYGGQAFGWNALGTADELGWMVNSIRERANVSMAGQIIFDVEILDWRLERDRLTGANFVK